MKLSSRDPLRRGAAGLLALILTLILSACSEDQKAPSPPALSPGATVTPSTSPTASPKKTPTPAPTPATDPLTGGKLSTAEVFAVKIENTAAARPQVGLNQADIVVVEEVEAQITRMIGIFHSRYPDRVGPVRSARNTDAELLPMFGKPGLVYSGANAKVQRNLRQASMVPIERSDRDHRRVAPHNVMVNLAAIAQANTVGGARSIGWTFAAHDKRWDSATSAPSTIKVVVGRDSTAFRYADGRYAVSWNGRANVDGVTGKPVLTDNVIVLSVKNHHDNDSTSDISVVSETVGKGDVTIYRDGKKLSGRWQRSKVNAPMHFTDAKGADIPLKPGQSWLMLQG